MSRAERYNTKPSVKRGNKATGVLLSIMGIALMLAVVFACMCLVIPRIAGYDTYVVVSGSMEPAIPVRSIVFAKEKDPQLLQAGDVIVFVDPAISTTPITHRVVSNNTSDGTVITKGDANPAEDPDPITYDNIKGKVDAHVPRMGYVASMLTSFLGKAVAALLLIEAWLLIEIGRRIRAR